MNRQIENLRPFFYSMNTRGGGSAGGWHFFVCEAIDDTAQTLIPDGERDVTAIIEVIYAAKHSGGGTSTGTAAAVPGGTAHLYSSGGNTLTLSVAANGAVTVQRTSGSGTFDLSMLGVWI